MHLFTTPDYLLPTLADQAVILFNLFPQRILFPPSSQRNGIRIISTITRLVFTSMLPCALCAVLSSTWLRSSYDCSVYRCNKCCCFLALKSNSCYESYLRAAILASMSLLSVSGVVSRWLSVPASESI